MKNIKFKIAFIFSANVVECCCFLDRTTTDAAAAYKRPLALRVGDGNNKYDLANVLAHLRYHVELLQLEDNIEDCTLFWEMRNKLPEHGESFFLPRVYIFRLLLHYFNLLILR